MVKEWKDGVGVTMVRNPNYWNPKAQHVDEIFYMVISNEPARFKALQAGTVDVMYITRGYFGEIKKDANLKVITGPRGNAGFLVSFNNSKPPFNDLRVRKALAHAIDRRALTRVGGSEREPSNDWYGKGHPWECKNVKWPEYNPAKAKALLKDYGKPIKAVLNHFPVTHVGRSAEAVAVMWRKVGVQATAKKGGRGPAYLRPLLTGKFDLFTFVGGLTPDPALVAAYYHSKHPSNKMFKIKDPKVDAALIKLGNARGKAARHAASCEYQQLLVDQQRYIGWDVLSENVAYRTHVKGVVRPFSTVYDPHKYAVK
jgi:ABC-type transport system substrate-binding protein